MLVSGGADGVGAEASRLFAAEGGRISIVDIQTAKAEALASELSKGGTEAIGIGADVGDEAAVVRAVATALARFGTVDVPYNHAGRAIVKPFHETTTEEWMSLFATNVHSMFFMNRALIPGMLAKGKGVIANTSSVNALLATPMEVPYCAAKGACHTFTKAIATEYRDQNIRCNAVCPGFIRTGHGLREIDALRGYGVNVSETDITDMQGRICEPVEIARAVLFLASEDASFINGETLFVDNGLSVRT